MTAPREPIAIIGIGCRFPGASDPAAFWNLLVSGKNVVGEIPKDRFDLEEFYDPRPATPGKVSTRYGGFLQEIDRFDAEFFGISPREAERLDPQQRLLLEVGMGSPRRRRPAAGRPGGRPRPASSSAMWLNDYEGRAVRRPAPDRTST